MRMRRKALSNRRIPRGDIEHLLGLLHLYEYQVSDYPRKGCRFITCLGYTNDTVLSLCRMRSGFRLLEALTACWMHPWRPAICQISLTIIRHCTEVDGRAPSSGMLVDFVHMMNAARYTHRFTLFLGHDIAFLAERCEDEFTL